jgi:ferrochelatase
VAKRAANSAKADESIRTEKGSPLIATILQSRDALQAEAACPVEVAMNYGEPSIGDALCRLAAAGIDQLLLIPQYPHYAMSSWETVVVKTRREAAVIAPGMKIETVLPYFADDDYIEALVESAQPYLEKPHDHLLFSYHGLPARHLVKADSSRAHCQVVPDCCKVASPAHATCYKAQVTRTTEAFAARAGLDPSRWSISFQSRLVGEPWLSPYTDFEFERLAKEGRKRLLVITPAFITDCLETLEEIRMAGRETFLHAGGEWFEHIPCLNSQACFIRFLSGRVSQWLANPETVTAR